MTGPELTDAELMVGLSVAIVVESPLVDFEAVPTEDLERARARLGTLLDLRAEEKVRIESRKDESVD